MKEKLLTGAATALLLGVGAPAAANAAGDRPTPDFATAVVGEWTGTGVVYGNEVTLSRSWQPDLAGSFLRADMKVEMANGRSFRVLAYWKREGERRYRVVWMDESGTLEEYEALADAAGSALTIHYFHTGETDGEPAAWRRLIYRLTGPDSYEEEVSGTDADGWQQLAIFRFRRAK